MGDAKAKIILAPPAGIATTYYIDAGDDRIMAINHTEQEWSQVAQVVLQDSSGTIAALDYKGYKGYIYWGYGANYSLCAPLWCIAQKTDSRGGSIITALSLAGTFNLMNEDRASEAYVPDSSNTDTVKDILTALVEATLTCYSHCTAYVATFDDTTGIIDTFMPKDSFRIYLNDSRLSKIKQLMKHVGYKCRVEDDEEIHFFIPTTSGSTYDEEYDDVITGHNFFEKSVRKRVIIPGYFVVSSHPDHLDPFKGWTGYAKDDGYDALPTDLQKRTYKYFRVTGNTQCTNIATNLLLHKQMDAEKGHGFAPMNCLQEVFDYVKITDSKVGSGDDRTGNIGYINRKYLATGRPEDFSMEFRFGSVAPGQYLGTMPPATTGITTAALAIGQMSLWDAVNAIFAGDPETGWLGLAHYMPNFDERITEAKDEILQIEPDAGIPSGGMEGGINWRSIFDGSTDTPTSVDWALETGLPSVFTSFFSPIIEEVPNIWVVYVLDYTNNELWKYNLTEKGWTKLSSPAITVVNGYRTLAINPLGTKLACVSADATGIRLISIYTIGTNTWVNSTACPDILGTFGSLHSIVWEDNDTIWAWATKGAVSNNGYAKCIKYVLSTDTWTQYANDTGLQDFVQGRCAAIRGTTIVYGGMIGAGGAGADAPYATYTIATDTYAFVARQGYQYGFAYDRDKLWYHHATTYRQGYLDTADNSTNDNQFAENLLGLASYYTFSDDLAYAIAKHSATPPELSSIISLPKEHSI